MARQAIHEAMSRTYTMDFGQENPVDSIIRDVWRAAKRSAHLEDARAGMALVDATKTLLRSLRVSHKCWYKNGVPARPWDSDDWNRDCQTCAQARDLNVVQATRPEVWDALSLSTPKGTK